MKLTIGECYSQTKYYEGFVDLDDFTQINVSICTSEDENTGNEIVLDVIIQDDIPEEYNEEEIINFVKENF